MDGFDSDLVERLEFVRGEITLVGDWLHARRKFDEAINAFPMHFKGEIKVRFGLGNELFLRDCRDKTL